MALLTRYIRVHPKQPQRGFRTSRFSIYGYMFQESEGWYRATFSEEQWDYLRNVRNSESNPDSPAVFQIADEAGRVAIETAERQAKIREITAPLQRTVDLTTTDLRHAVAPTTTAAETARAVRAARYDAQEDGLEDLASPAAPAAPVAVASSAASPVVKRGRGRPRKEASSVPVGTAVERVSVEPAVAPASTPPESAT
jgi:hypothetical protein